ncbi:MAG: hypothetical protein KA978_08265 [Deltaproteobacteria bacterium]|nr:hypothetical protein [Deltaproteobacteria bacterium]
MAKAKTTTVSKKQPATAPSPAKSAARKPEVATAPSRAPLPSKADVQPDVSVGALVLHSERLVKTAATHADELTTAKVTAADRRELSARIAALREAEAAWKKARVASAPGAVAKGRAALTLGREDLLGALRAFADHDEATQLALDAVGSVDDDDDLEADVEALVPLARAHAADLDGTEITPAHVDTVASLLVAFRLVRAGLRSHGDDPTTAQALSKAALSARRARNEAFWALSQLNRQVSGRARFCFRRDAKVKALYGNYSAERSGSRKPSPANDPAKPTG